MRLFWPVERIAIRMGQSVCLDMNSIMQETQAIARGLRRRDPDLLDELINRYQYRLPRYLWTLTGNRVAAEDLFQETWIRVIEKSHLYNPQWRFETWLFSIARNLAIDLLRQRHPESLDALLHPRDERAAPQWPDLGTATPYETAAASERAGRPDYCSTGQLSWEHAEAREARTGSSSPSGQFALQASKR